VVATSDVVALRLSRAAFKKVMSEEPGIAYRVMEALVSRIRELDDEAGARGN
jgi:CRP-like cAMP-binding protein